MISTMTRSTARVFLLVGFPLLLVGLVNLGVHFYRVLTWETADGVMFADTDLRPVEFETRSGELIRAGNVISLRRHVEVGERFTVHYHPADPHRAFVGLSGPAIFALPLLAVGGVFLLVMLLRRTT